MPRYSRTHDWYRLVKSVLVAEEDDRALSRRAVALEFGEDLLASVIEDDLAQVRDGRVYCTLKGRRYVAGVRRP